MAVDALQLRPRHPLALFDASLRAVASSSGLWVATMPAAALVVFAFFQTAEAVQRGRSLTGPVALLTFAFAARCLAQGAASQLLERQILSLDEPTLPGALLAALRRLPSLVVAGTTQLVLDALLATLTLGLGFFFVGAHQCLFAVAMRGEGSALGLVGVTSRLLGSARHTAPLVRLCNGLQLLLALNLHVAAGFLVFLGQQLLALDLNFLERFASLDNGVWLATLFVVAWALFEPVRAATGVLLLIDGRVRQEGLDLIAQVEQLPRRRRPRAPAAALAALALLALPALAQPSPEPTALRQRVARLLDECEMEPRVEPAQVQRLDRVPQRDVAALSRFIARVERRAYDDQDCDAAERDLREGLTEVEATLGADAAADAKAARDDAAQILARPEFQQRDEKPEAKEAEETDDGAFASVKEWLARLLKRFFEWLLDRDDREGLKAPSLAGGEMAGANVVMLVVLVLLVALFVFILVQLVAKQPAPPELGDGLGASEAALSADPMSALSKRPETWAGLADELAARGEYREAIRHLYLALLSTLHRGGVIDYEPTRSNWDYLATSKGGSAQKSAFRELTRRFDFAWYGNLETSDGAFRTFRRIVEPLLTPSEPRADA